MPAAPVISRNSRGDDVAKLHEQLAQLNIKVPKFEREQRVFGVGTEAAIRGVQTRSGLSSTGSVDEATASALASMVAEAQGGNRLEGRIFFENGLPAAGVQVRLYQRSVGGAAPLLGNAVTDDEGYYHLPYDTPGSELNLELRTVDERGQETSLA